MKLPSLACHALAAAAAVLVAVPLAAQQAAPARPAAAASEAARIGRLGAETRKDLTCAAVFAVMASEQQRGVKSALALPPLQMRGREFFVRTGARAMDEAGLTREAVRGLFEAEVTRLQGEAKAGGDPDATIAAVMPGCLARLDATVAQLEKPGLAQCTAIMQLAYEEVHGREGLTARARDLKTLASVLEARERKALAAKGLSGNAADRAVIESHDKMLAQATADGPGVERYDLQTCYDLAKPEESKHY